MDRCGLTLRSIVARAESGLCGAVLAILSRNLRHSGVGDPIETVLSAICPPNAARAAAWLGGPGPASARHDGE